MTGAAATAALLLSIGLLCVRRIDTMAALCAVQAVCAAVALRPEAAALAALALNGVLMPAAIAHVAGATPLTRRGGTLAPWAAALLILVATGAGLAKAGTDGSVAAGTSVTLLGLLLIVVRHGALAPALGMLSSQNGLVLLAGALPVLPWPTAVAATLPIIPALVLAEQWLRR